MKTSAKVVMGVALAMAMTAAHAVKKAEFNDECAFGLTLGKHVPTDCSVSEQIDGKTYCFSSDGSRQKFMKDPKGNLAKALESFGKK